MPNHPYDEILVDGIDVSKGDHRIFVRLHHILQFDTAQDIRDTDLRATGAMPAQRYIGFDGKTYKLDADDLTSADDGQEVIISNGLHYHLMAGGGSGNSIDAAGLLSQRSVYDNEENGFSFFATDTELLYVKLSSGSPTQWSDGTTIGPGDDIDIAVYFAQKPNNGETIFRMRMVRTVQFGDGLPGSVANAAVAAAASTVFSIRKNGVQFATMTFALSGTTATFACPTDTTFVANDLLEIVGPSTADATLSDLNITLVGTR